MKNSKPFCQVRGEGAAKVHPLIITALAKLYTRKQVAERLQTCTHTIARWSRLGLLPCVIINRRVIRYRPEDVEAFVERSIAKATV